jgi:hypothetical protein
MPVLESPYFEYFCALYEPVLHSQTNLHLFLEAVNSVGIIALLSRFARTHARPHTRWCAS